MMSDIRPGTSFHMKLIVRDALRKSRREFRSAFNHVFTDENGRELTLYEAREALMNELAKGHEVIPVGTCDNFDYSGRGCLGHVKPVEATGEVKE